MRHKFNVFSTKLIKQHLLHLQAKFSVVNVPREKRQTSNKLAVHVFTHKQLNTMALLYIQDALCHVQQFIFGNLKQLVPRIEGENLLKLLTGVICPQEPGAFHHALKLALEQWNLIWPLVISTRGVQPQEPAFANHLALLVELLYGDIVRIGGAVNP